LSSAQTLTCASCGSHEPAGSAFCGNCGAPFAAPETEVLETSTATASAGVLTCAICGNEEPEGSEFCGNCGTPFIAAPTTVVTSAAAEVDSWPEPQPQPVPEPELPPLAPGPPRRRRPLVLSALGVLIVGGVLGVLFGTGALSGSSRLPESAFLRQVNVGALGPLRQAVEAAAQDAAVNGAVSGDGIRIVQASNGGAQYLRVLQGLTGRQREEVKLLLAYFAANVSFGQALGAFNRADSGTLAALDSAVQGVRSTRTPVEGTLPTGLDLAPQESYVSSQALPPPPPPPPPASVTTSAGSYVEQVDDLLRRSRSVVVSLGSFVPRAARDEMSRSAAVIAAQSYLGQRRLELGRAQALGIPPEFAPAQALLVRSLQVSVADDEALVAWTLARRDGAGNAQAAFAQANRLGAQATTLKRQFLRVYGPLRQRATGRAPGSLPGIF
jgi:Double zinc ribbon